jgi:mono/diheme cytochrome c family protein
MRRLWPLLLLLSAPAWAGKPRVEFAETEYDFGLLIQGTTVQHGFDLRNTGGAPLEIQAVNTSCGCTAAVATDKTLPPGKRSRIDVTYDSRAKFGDFEKDVRVWTSDPERPLTLLRIRGKVLPSDHPELTGTRNLFQGSCAACHAAPAAGKKGRDLFNAACAMCHTPQGQEGRMVGPGLQDMALMSKKSLTRTLLKGKPGTSMAAFSARAGGPLDPGQITSLVDFIESSKHK